MSRVVFISYSIEDKKIADAICHVLETNRISCWIAPRNVTSGKELDEEINSAIEDSKMMVLVFSRGSQNSSLVKNEINLAFSNNKPIFSFKIEDFVPEKSFESYLSGVHVDAYLNQEKEYENLLKHVVKFMETNNIEINDLNTKKTNKNIFNTPHALMSLFIYFIPGFGWLGFIYTGIMEKEKKYFAYSLVYLIIGLIFYFMSGSLEIKSYYSVTEDYYLSFWYFLYFIIIIHGILLYPSYRK